MIGLPRGRQIILLVHQTAAVGFRSSYVAEQCREIRHLFVC